jgi:outer membrane lipoprotein-sorting protein
MLMQRDFRTAFVVALLVTARAAAGLEDPPSQPGSDVRLARLLNDWQSRSATWTTLDVRFTGRARSQVWGDESLTGRVVLLPKGRAYLEVVTCDGAGKVVGTERFIWTDDALHQIRAEQKTHIVWPIAVNDRGRLPAALALPFLWHVTAEELTSRYRVEVIKEEAEFWVLRAEPLTEAGKWSMSRAFIQLDRATYLPHRYLVISPDGKSTKDYRVTEARRNQPVPDDVLRIPDDPGPIVSPKEKEAKAATWISRWFKPDLLP